MLVRLDCMVLNTVLNSYFRYVAAISAPVHAFPEVSFTSTTNNIPSKPLAAFPMNQNNGQRTEKEGFGKHCGKKAMLLDTP